MTDKGDTKSGGALRALGLRPKITTPIVAISDDELHDEAVVHALTGTRQLRNDLSEWKHKAEATAAEFAAFRQDTAQEMMTLKHEYDSKLTMLRAKIEAQDGLLQDSGRKLEHFERLSFELSTKCDDIEKFYVHELRNIRDAASHAMFSLLSSINNATVGLNEAAKHSGDGLMKQVENSANNMSSFIDDLRAKRDAGEYRPRPNPMEEKRMKPLAPDAEQELAKLVQQIKTKPYEEAEKKSEQENTAEP